MADGFPVQLPIQHIVSSDPLREELLRIQVNSGDTTALQFDLRLDSDDSDAVVPIFSVPAGTYVTDIGWFVSVIFTASNIFSIGDGDDANGWGDSLVIGSTLLDTGIMWASKAWTDQDTGLLEHSSDVANISSDNHAFYMGGKLYEADDNIDLTIKTGNSPAGGVVTVYIKYFSGWGVPKFGGVWDSAEF